MRNLKIALIGIVLMTFTTAQAAIVGLADYAGTITYDGGDGGITGLTTGNINEWLDDDTSLSWKVTDNGGSWTYKYILDVGDKKDISHFIIQVSDNFTKDDYLSGTPINDGPSEFGDEGGSNPSIPETFYSLKFKPSGDTTHYEVEFTTTRGPTWGDFYAVDGKKPAKDDDPSEIPAIWNVGFTSSDGDNPVKTANGEWDHIVVPDTFTYTVPAPAAVLLGMLGTCTVSWLRRRRTV